MFTRIFDGLDAMDLIGTPARDAARLGFLEWVPSLDGALAPDAEARAALSSMPNDVMPSPAARAFLGFVTEAAKPQLANPVRRGGRRRLLH